MSESSSPVGKISVVIMIFLLVAIAAMIAYNVVIQGKVQELTTQVAQSKEQIATAELLVAQTKAQQAQKEQEMSVAQQFAELDNPAARLALVKKYYSKIAAALKPATKNQVDTVIIYVEKQPAVLVDPTQLPASYSAILAIAKDELKAAKVALAIKKVEEATTVTASASTVIGKTYQLTGMFNFAHDDPVLGGSYFKMTDTNYGEPFYLYLSSANAASAKTELDNQIATVKVKVTGQKDGYVSYDVLSGPTLATNQ